MLGGSMFGQDHPAGYPIYGAFMGPVLGALQLTTAVPVGGVRGIEGLGLMRTVGAPAGRAVERA